MENLYCGIDFHKRTCSICIVNLKGDVIQETKIQTSLLIKFFSNRKFAKIGIEASGGTNHAVQLLKADKHDVIIINPNKFKAIGIGGKKTDEKDARAIAEALRLNYLPEVYHKSQYAREIKSLLMGREMLVRSRVNFTNHVRGTLREYGRTMPVGMESFFENAALEIEQLENDYIKKYLQDMLAKIIELKKQELDVDQKLLEFTKNDEKIKRLQTIPGVGPLSALAITSVVDEIERFPDSKSFASYLGLVPKEYSSGDKRMMGSITRSGSEMLRRYLIHGARAVLMHTSDKNIKDPNRMWALKMKNRIGMNKATVALAHRLARIVYSVLKNNDVYNLSKARTGQEIVVDKKAA